MRSAVGRGREKVLRGSIPPALLPHREPVECLAVSLPLWHEAVHQSDEPGVVGGLQQVNQFVDNDVFEALAGFLGEIGVEADGVGLRIAASPLGLHPPHEDPADFNTHQRFPLGNHRRDRCLELLAIP